MVCSQTGKPVHWKQLSCTFKNCLFTNFQIPSVSVVCLSSMHFISIFTTIVNSSIVNMFANVMHLLNGRHFESINLFNAHKNTVTCFTKENTGAQKSQVPSTWPMQYSASHAVSRHDDTKQARILGWIQKATLFYFLSCFFSRSSSFPIPEWNLGQTHDF